MIINDGLDFFNGGVGIALEYAAEFYVENGGAGVSFPFLIS